MIGPPLPIGVYGHAKINLGNEEVMVIGGSTGSDYLNQTFVYNQNHAFWSWGPVLNQARFNHAVGIVTDEATQEKFVFVAGGKNLNILNSTEILINQTFSFGKAFFLSEAIQGLNLILSTSSFIWYKNAKRIHMKVMFI